ncbi:hypothetical protein BOX15_Mlig034571g3, partial [Macrostomum lignano]
PSQPAPTGWQPMDFPPPPPPSSACFYAARASDDGEAADDDDLERRRLVDLLDLNPTVLCDRALLNAETAQAALAVARPQQRQLVPCGFVSPPLHVFVCLDRCVRLRRLELRPAYARHRLRSAQLLGAAAQSQRLTDIIARLKSGGSGCSDSRQLAAELDSCPGLVRLASLRFPAEMRRCRFDVAPPAGARVRVAVLRITSVQPGCLPAFSGLRLLADPPEPLAVPARVAAKPPPPLPLQSLMSPPLLPPTLLSPPLMSPVPLPPPPNVTSPSASRSPTPPEEFVDPITCELMQTPVLLPCGKSIDQATLARCQQTGDPFTGLAFTQDRRPVFNSALKLRLDDFLALRRRRKRAAQTAAAETAAARASAKRRRWFLPADLDPYSQLAALPESSCQLCNAKDTRHAWYRLPCSRDRVICYACRMSISVMSCKLCYSSHTQAEFRANKLPVDGADGTGGDWPNCFR